MVAALTTKVFGGFIKAPGEAMLRSMESTQGFDDQLVRDAKAISSSMNASKAGGSRLHQQARRFLRLPEVKQITGLGKTTIYALMKSGEFPRGVRISGRAVGWIEEEVAQWVQDRILEARINPLPRSGQLAA